MPLKGIPKLLSPDILHALSSMGHGDEVVLADAHFPASSVCKSSGVGTIEIRADACNSLPKMLEAVLKVLPLDEYVRSPLFLMQRVECDKDTDVPVWQEYRQIVDASQEVGKKKVEFEQVERFAFYEQAKKAFAVIQVGDNAKYGNIILKKGLALDD